MKAYSACHWAEACYLFLRASLTMTFLSGKLSFLCTFLSTKLKWIEWNCANSLTCPRYPADTSGVPQFSAAVTVKSGPSVAVLDSPFNSAEEGEGSMNTVEGRHTGLDTATPVTYELLDWNIRDINDNCAIYL